MQFPLVPFSFCSILKDNNIIYPLTLTFPNEELIEHINDSSKIAVCSSCKDSRLHRSPPNIIKTPSEIERVPMHYQHWLSPVFLSYSLRTTPHSNT